MISKYAEVLRIQFKNNWVREAVYRSNFLTMFVVDLIWILVEIALFGVIYANVPTLAGWTQEQVYFFLGIFFASDALFTTFFQRNYWMFPDMVNKGELDLFLTKPIHPLFLAFTRWFSLTSFLNFFFGIGVSVFFAESAGFEGGAKWLMLPLWLLFGVVTQLFLRFMFVIWVFWSERGMAFSYMYYQFYNLANKPDSIYPMAIRYVILTALPFAFVGSVPARALLHGLETWEYVLCFGVLFSLFFLCKMVWRKALLRYQSASS